MSDSALQDLRRRVRSGDATAEVPLLVARLRAAPACEKCGGRGQVEAIEVPVLLSSVLRGERYWRPLTNPHTVSCTACAGTGSPFRARVDLAAWLGSEAARHAVDPEHTTGTYFHLPPTADRPHGIHGDGIRFDEWLSDLKRWADVGPASEWVLVFAGNVAMSVKGARLRGPSGGGGRLLSGLTAVEEAARNAGEQPVRAAIQSSLSSWALQETNT